MFDPAFSDFVTLDDKPFYRPTKWDMKRLGVGKKLWHTSFSKIDQNLDYMKEVNNFVDNITENINSGKGLYLEGPFGSGKSSIATCIAKRVSSHGGYSFFVKAKDIPNLMINKWNTMFDNSVTYGNRVTYSNLLIIDDLGMEVGSDKTIQFVESLIREREENEMALVITTNKTLGELRSKGYSGCLNVSLHICKRLRIDGVCWRDPR